MIARSGGLVVTVRGRRARTVPVLARYHAPLLAAARFAGDGLVTGGTDPGRRNRCGPGCPGSTVQNVIIGQLALRKTMTGAGARLRSQDR